MSFLVNAPIYDSTGYAEAVRSMIPVFIRMGKTIIQPDYAWSQCASKIPKRLLSLIDSLLMNSAVQEENLVLYQTQILKAFPGNVQAVNICKTVHTMFETDKCPAHWVDNLNSADVVFNPSNFGVEVFKNSGVKNVEYLPFPINSDVFRPNVNKLVRAEEYKFMAFSDMSARKNLTGLLTAFFNVFRNSKEVCLILKSHISKDNLPPLMKDFKLIRSKFSCPEYPKVYLYPSLIGGGEISGFINSCDCFISPSCGEGFGLPALYAMACEKPVISIDWSSCRDYINQDTALPLTYKIDTVPYSIVKQDANFYGHQWAYPSVEHLSLLMEWVISHPEEGKQKGKKAREFVMEKYSINKVSDLLKGILKERGFGK